MTASASTQPSGASDEGLSRLLRFSTVPGRGELRLAVALASAAFGIVVIAGGYFWIFRVVPRSIYLQIYVLSILFLLVAVSATYISWMRRRHVLRDAEYLAVILEQVGVEKAVETELLVTATMMRNRLIGAGEFGSAERIHRAIISVAR
jgi:hypothetical protein